MLGLAFHRRLATATRNTGDSISHQERQRQLWVNLLSKPMASWDNGLGKRNPRHPDVGHKSSREPLWLLDSKCKPPWLDSHISALGEFLQQEGQGSSCLVGFDDVLQCLCKEGQLDRALGMLFYMNEHSVVPSDHTYWTLLKACNKQRTLNHAQQVHAHMVQHGLDLTSFLGEYLVTTLVKCGGLNYALRVFHMLPHPTVVSWTAVMAGFTDRGEGQEALRMYQHMQQKNVEPNEYTFVALLKACASTPDLDKGKALHADVRRMGFDLNAFVGSTLVTMYGNCGSVLDAEIVFGGLMRHDTVSWTAMLSVYVEQGLGKKAMQLYRQMQDEGVSLDERCFVIALQACCALFEEKEALNAEGWWSAKVASLEIGQALHADSKGKGFVSNVFLGSTLVSMYGKLGSILEAENVFDMLPRQSVVVWNAMLSAYVEQSLEEKALHFYCQMQKEVGGPDERSVAIMLQACCILAEKEEAIAVMGQSTKIMYLEIGRALYADAQEKGFASDIIICSTLVSLYGKCGSIMGAENVFHTLSEYDITSWNVMLSAYADGGQAGKALQLCKQMQEKGVIPNDVTLVHILQVCSETGSIEMCRQTHLTTLLTGSDLSPLMVNTLVHAYGSCASMVHAREVFDRLLHPDIVSWNALIAGYAHEGDCAASLNTFEEMQLAGVKPDGYTFLSIFSACSHVGLVDKGVMCFESMCTDYAITPEIKHYVSMVDLLGRAGNFRRVENVLWRMPMQPDVATWLCLLRACRTHGNVELGKYALDCAVHLHSQRSIHDEAESAQNRWTPSNKSV